MTRQADRLEAIAERLKSPKSYSYISRHADSVACLKIAETLRLAEERITLALARLEKVK